MSAKETLATKRDEVFTLLQSYKVARNTIISGAAQSYSVKDGDSEIQVTSLSLKYVENRISELQSQYDALNAEINGTSTVAGKQAFRIGVSWNV